VTLSSLISIQLRKIPMTPSLHRLYSFRRCPYAMRARLGLLFAELQVELREIILKNKPAQMLAISPKGTVPVLQVLEALLTKNSYLLGDSATIADIGIMPFIRQFAHVDRDVFYSLPYPKLQLWLQHWLEHSFFLQAMTKFQPWQEGDEVVFFPS